MPFAIVASENDVITRDGHKVKGRQYPWGYVDVENEEHSDFKKLKSLLIRTHMDDLIENTDLVHYENFCRRRNPRMSVIAPATATR
jgi:cell division control protein 12